jgi:hypothetical protein
MKGYVPFLLLASAWGLASPAMAASEQAIRDCQASSMNPLVVSACIKKLTSKSSRIAEIECRKDLECWGKYNEKRAQRNCAPGFTRAAQWDANWWQLWDEQELTHVRWRCNAHVQRLAIRLGVHGHRLDPELAARADDAQRNLPAVGNQDFLEHVGRLTAYAVSSVSKSLHELSLEPATPCTRRANSLGFVA